MKASQLSQTDYHLFSPCDDIKPNSSFSDLKLLLQKIQEKKNPILNYEIYPPFTKWKEDVRLKKKFVDFMSAIGLNGGTV